MAYEINPIDIEQAVNMFRAAQDATIETSDTDYFDRWDRNVHHKDFAIERTKRREALTEAFMNWHNSNLAYGVVRDRKNDFKKTWTTNELGERKLTSYPLFQSLRNIVSRANLLCNCDTSTYLCKCENHLEDIRAINRQYPDARFVDIKRAFHLKYCLSNCGKVKIFWNVRVPNLIVVYRHGANNPWEIVQ